MLKGLYTAYTGMLNEQNRMDVLSNNLANSATTGFKKEGTTSQGFKDVLTYRIKDQSVTGMYDNANIGIGTPGVKIGENYIDYSQGSFRETGNTYDLALSGNGFFNVEFAQKDGGKNTYYTRDGSFTLTKDGYVVNKDGDYLLSTSNSHIRVNPNIDASIDQAGRIMQNGNVVAQVKVTDFKDYNYLERYGENYFTPVEGAQTIQSNAKVYTGYLEASNVQTVSEMVELISITRQYEANQKIVQAYDESLQIAVSQVGKL